MATRRLAINGATTALRGGSSRLTGSGSATIPTAARILRASFGTTSLGPQQAAKGAARGFARPQLFRRIAPTSVRWSSDSATGSGSKIWNFEEVRYFDPLTHPFPSSPSPTNYITNPLLPDQRRLIHPNIHPQSHHNRHPRALGAIHDRPHPRRPERPDRQRAGQFPHPGRRVRRPIRVRAAAAR